LLWINYFLPVKTFNPLEKKMKSLTKTRQIASQKTNTLKKEEKKDTQAVAQCCAKVSKVVAGCHD
jgi:hypothetical protein